MVVFLLSLKLGNIPSLMLSFLFQFCRKRSENTGEELQTVSVWCLGGFKACILNIIKRGRKVGWVFWF